MPKQPKTHFWAASTTTRRIKGNNTENKAFELNPKRRSRESLPHPHIAEPQILQLLPKSIGGKQKREAIQRNTALRTYKRRRRCNKLYYNSSSTSFPLGAIKNRLLRPISSNKRLKEMDSIRRTMGLKSIEWLSACLIILHLFNLCKYIQLLTTISAKLLFP